MNNSGLNKPERFHARHRLCAGCGAGIVCRAMMRAVDPKDKAVICNAQICLRHDYPGRSRIGG